jgi:oxalate decarboxylase/phosphoglucose isomerase-like protein (cupin superfamily)
MFLILTQIGFLLLSGACMHALFVCVFPQVVDVMVADLSRGDVLYLPPMYFHRVATMPEDFAMAVNVWSSRFVVPKCLFIARQSVLRPR